ncbi:MAG: hypothetical protein EU533_01700 [Promethearchaeota archaeon]|nr:MAG: hypothetical protein EU533_01700 [Candidatus Lokiarchaeota archaeon]
MPVNQLSVFIPNKPGQLAQFFELLMDKKIFIRSCTVAETEEFGLLLLLVDNPKKCIEILEDNNILYSITEVIAVELSENISQLYNIAKTLGAHGVNIDYLYFLVLNSHKNGIILKLDDNEKGVEILKEHGFKLLEDFN